MLPSNCSTIYWEIIRPSPMPLMFTFWLSLRNPKSLKSLQWSCSGIPIPVSITDILRNFSWSSFKTIWIIVLTRPSYVNLIAFDWRLIRTCMILCSSQHIWAEWPTIEDSWLSEMLKNSTSNLMPLCLAFCACISITLRTVSLMLKVLKFYLNIPDLIWEKSSMSWIMKFMNLAEFSCIILPSSSFLIILRQLS